MTEAPLKGGFTSMKKKLMIGLILFLCWKDNKPVSAKQAVIGAAIGFGISMLSSIIMTVIGAM